jgi:hypothetical protein
MCCHYCLKRIKFILGSQMWALTHGQLGRSISIWLICDRSYDKLEMTMSTECENVGNWRERNLDITDLLWKAFTQDVVPRREVRRYLDSFVHLLALTMHPTSKHVVNAPADEKTSHRTKKTSGYSLNGHIHLHIISNCFAYIIHSTRLLPIDNVICR